MPFKSKLTLKSKIFDPAERKKAFSSVVTRSARNFKESTRRKMVESQPAGRAERYLSGEGAGFSRGFRRSRRGQRPAVETTTLINAIQMTPTSELSAKVDIADKRNPRNGESARVYAEKLQSEAFGRKIMVEEDIKEAREDFDNRLNRTLKDLV